MTQASMRPLLSALVFAAVSAGAAEAPAWAVPDAAVRVSVRVDTLPDHKDLGVFVKIPAGDALPGKYQTVEVRDDKGNPLESLIVGYNPNDALGVLFAQPESGSTVDIYLKPSATPPAKPATTHLYPSVLLYTRNGNASLENAKRMATEYPPASGGSFGVWPCIGSMVNPFGPDNDFSSWYVGAILLKKRENIYFATVSNAGSEFWIDGKMIHSWPGVHTRDGGAKGEHGATVDLAEGLHRIDYYHFAQRGGKQESQLTWRRPGMATKGNVPELISEFAKSGNASIASISLKDGRIGGVIRSVNEPYGYLWTGDQPLNIYLLSYSGVAPDSNTSVAWEFGKNRRLNEPYAEWIVPGDPDALSYPVTLAVSNAAGIARSNARLICPWTPSELSLDKPSDRLNFRKALYNSLRSAPASADPCTDWSPDYWEILVELLEPYRAGPILMDIFTRSFDTLQKIPAERRWALEDRFVETLRLQRNDKLLLDWIAKLEANEKNSARKFRWKDERVCAFLFDINDSAAAKREVAFLKEMAIAPDQTQIAALRQGDVERILGNAEAATKCYNDAQERYRSRNKTGMAGGRLAYVDPKKRKEPKSTNEVDKASSKKPKLQSLTSQKKVDDWKIYTVHDASMYATVISDLSQDAVAEAFQKLADWENESPQSKFGGEFPLAEAHVYLHVEDYRRAINTLDHLRKTVTMNAQLADAMKLEIDSLHKVGDKARAKEVATDFLKRFPGHPYEAQMKEELTP